MNILLSVYIYSPKAKYLTIAAIQAPSSMYLNTIDFGGTSVHNQVQDGSLRLQFVLQSFCKKRKKERPVQNALRVSL